MTIDAVRRGLRAAGRQPLAFDLHRADVLAGVMGTLSRGGVVADQAIASAVTGNGDLEPVAGPQIVPGPRGGKAVAIVSMRGVALYDIEYQPWAFSTALLAQTITSLANDPEIGTIILDVDSPGGAVTGTMEAADAVFAARQRKTVVAVVNPLCASAAFWIASQATEVIAVPSSDLGSVGVFMLHLDYSEMLKMDGVKPTFVKAGLYKTEGNSLEPLSEEGQAHYQDEVDAIYADFKKALARGRGVSVADVEANFGQGRTLTASAAKKAGMIDRIATADAALSRFGIITGAARRRVEDLQPEPEATATAAEHDPEDDEDDEVDPDCEPDDEAERKRKANARKRRLAILAA